MCFKIEAHVTEAIFIMLLEHLSNHPLATLQLNMIDVTARFLASKSRHKWVAIVDTCTDK